MKKTFILFLGVLLMVGCSVTKDHIVIQGNNGYQVTGKDTTLLNTQEVIEIKELMSQYDGMLVADLKQSVIDFYDGDVDLDTLSLPF